MPLSEPYHVAYIVEDLEQAMPRYEPILGVEFREPMRRTLIEGTGPELRQPADESFEVVFTYSIADRQPYVELIQAGSGPIFGAEQGEGFHHVGIWVPDIVAAQTSQRQVAAECEGRFFSPDGAERVWFAQTGGVRAEFVNEAVRPQTEEWLPAGRSWRNA